MRELLLHPRAIEPFLEDLVVLGAVECDLAVVRTQLAKLQHVSERDVRRAARMLERRLARIPLPEIDSDRDVRVVCAALWPSWSPIEVEPA